MTLHTTLVFTCQSTLKTKTVTIGTWRSTLNLPFGQALRRAQESTSTPSRLKRQQKALGIQSNVKPQQILASVLALSLKCLPRMLAEAQRHSKPAQYNLWEYWVRHNRSFH